MMHKMLIFVAQAIFSLHSEVLHHLREVNVSQPLPSPFLVLMVANGNVHACYPEDLM